MDVYWLEQSEADVPGGENWLGPNELAILQGMRFPKRRADWLLGRWTAKNAFATCFGYSTDLQEIRNIEIRTASSGAPEVFLQGQHATATISLSHRGGYAACAVALADVPLGCDLEIIEPHGDGFAADYFTAEEQALVAQATSAAGRARLLALFWSAKESALKALREGLRLDTRSVVVSFPSQPEKVSTQTVWSPLQVRGTDGQIQQGWWSQSGSILRTVLGMPAPASPILLAQQYCLA